MLVSDFVFVLAVSACVCVCVSHSLVNAGSTNRIWYYVVAGFFVSISDFADIVRYWMAISRILDNRGYAYLPIDSRSAYKRVQIQCIHKESSKTLFTQGMGHKHQSQYPIWTTITTTKQYNIRFVQQIYREHRIIYIRSKNCAAREFVFVFGLVVAHCMHAQRISMFPYLSSIDEFSSLNACHYFVIPMW